MCICCGYFEFAVLFPDSRLLLNKGYTQKKINERIQEHADNEAEDIYGSIYGALDDS